MINKRGSHVGMILSFLVFVTFVGFLYSVIEPATRSQEDKLYLVDFLKVELLNEFSGDVSILTARVHSIPLNQKCISFPVPDQELQEKGIIVKDSEGTILPSYMEGSLTNVKYLSGEVLQIYYSDELNSSKIIISSCHPLGDDFEISLFKTTEEIFESKIIEISENINSNNSNYEELKQKLGVGVGNEFGFVFNNGTKEFVAGTVDKNVSTDVFVEEIPIQYMDSKANIKPGFLNIKVW